MVTKPQKELIKKTSLKAINSLGNVVEEYQLGNLNNYELEKVRDAMIKRFEYSLDNLWKLLKIKLEQDYGVISKAREDLSALKYRAS